MRDRCRELIKLGDSLFTKKAPLLSLWQQLAENFHVMRADMTRRRFLSEEFASYLMTGRPALAHRDLSNSIAAMMRPRDRQWVWARTNDERINADREARAYLDWMSRVQFRAMYDPRACLVRSCKEADGDWSAFGNAVKTVEANAQRDGMLIRCWHPRDVVWTENNALKVVQVHHKRIDSVRDVVSMFPDTAAARLKEQRMRDDPDGDVHCRRIVIPSDEYDLPIRNKERFPYCIIDLDTDNDTLLAETPARSHPYVIDRWVTVSGSQYAYSPAAVLGLPDARMLQQITLTMLEAGQKATDPPMIAVSEAIAGGINSGAGMVTWADADYDERTGEVLRPMEMRFDGIRFGAEREERIEGNLDATFFLNQLRMPQVTKEMTAYEASRLYEEFQRNSLPLLEPLEVDHGNLCSAAFEVLLQLGEFGDPMDMPRILRGQELRWEFDTPLKAAAEQAKIFAFQQVTTILGQAMSIDPDAALELDMRKAERDAVIGAGGADWLKPDEQALAARQQRANQAAAAAEAQQTAQGAEVATRVAAAAKGAGEAGSALREGGLLQ